MIVLRNRKATCIAALLHAIVDGANVSYFAGVEMGIQPGQLAGEIPQAPGAQQGTLEGLIGPQGIGPSPSGVALAVQADALQQIATNGARIAVPLLPSESPYNEAMLTTSASSCAPGVVCALFAMRTSIAFVRWQDRPMFEVM
jgi:hypothetical protein